MKLVRQWMIKPFKNELSHWGSLSLLALLLILASCNPAELSAPSAQSNRSYFDGSYANRAYVYLDNPNAYAGPSYGPVAPDMGMFVDGTPQVITTNSTLTGDCSMNFFFYADYTSDIASCLRVFPNHTTTQSITKNSDGTWIFDNNSAKFYQTNALFHVQKGTNTFFKKLEFAYNQVQGMSIAVPKSIPSYLKDSGMFWFKGVTNTDSQHFRNDYLTAYSQCEYANNSSFSPAGPELCFGYLADYPGIYFIQDPSVIYHELGHALISVMLNLRNASAISAHPLRSTMSNYGYSEASSINEGLADYYSFVMNKRTHFAEWALGRTVNQSRPMSEDDPMHITGISTTSEGRLSYPQYLLYDPNHPTVIKEDVHYAGQIISHYLVALTKTLKTECSLTSNDDGGHDAATSFVLLLLAETLSELGDLNAKGVDDFAAPFASSVYFNNLDPDASFLWTHFNNPITYRRFSQVFAKNIYKYISSSLCTGFTKNESEKLLDDYGLLLFKTYNDNGNSTKDRNITYHDAVYFIPAQGLTPVSESNRRKSVLVSKQLLDIAESTDTQTRVKYYVIDSQTSMSSFLSGLLFKGLAVPLSSGTSSTEYNNGNGKISPGEVLGIIPNLFNSSNSSMAGVQVLATDWDHVHITSNVTGNFKPCEVDTKTTVDEGAESALTCATTDSSYSRLVKNSTTGLFPSNAAAPVCLVQLEEGTSTRWVSQNEFRKKQGLSLLDKDCLGYSTTGTSDTDFTFNPHECLVRFLPGANSASFSKIDAQKSYYDTVIKESEDKSFNWGGALVMEVNKWIPPGTKFRCRLRARFSNCSDCYTDGTNSNDDYLEYEYNGSKPFKVINLEFEVND
ncbi:MAG: hypothetical protein AB7I27_09160 [Bacteriovoracaceae bacterium]